MESDSWLEDRSSVCYLHLVTVNYYSYYATSCNQNFSNSPIPPSYFRYIKYSSYILDTLDILEIFQQIER